MVVIRENRALGRSSHAPAPMNEIQEVFSGNTPQCVEALLYMVSQPVQDPLAESTLESIYRCFLEDIDDDARKLTLLCFVRQVQELELEPEALLPFCRFDTNHQIVNDAVRSYLQCKRGTLDEPFLAASVLLELFDEGKIRNSGAAFAGLVCFGDRRLCSVLRTTRDSLSVPELRAFARGVSSPIFEATIEFCVDWLIDLADNRDFEKAVHVASAIASIVINDSSHLVYRPNFHFGPMLFPNGNQTDPVRLNELLGDLEPMLETLRRYGMPTVDRMIEIISDPMAASVSNLDRRTQSNRRQKSDRRGSDRRIVDIKPAIERRSGDRRELNRRQRVRR